MKTLVLCLEGVTPDRLFGNEHLENLRCLMAAGCYGLLEGVKPSTPIPAWASMVTSQDPGSLGLYGSRGRVDRSYLGPSLVAEMQQPCIWNSLSGANDQIHLIGVPAGFRRSDACGSSEPESDSSPTRQELFSRVGGLLCTASWSYLQLHDPGSNNSLPQEDYRELDAELGNLLAELDDSTIVLVVSAYGLRPNHGAFALNQWLVEQNWLVLDDHSPATSQSLSDLSVNWNKTKAWAIGGETAQIYLNVKGREPRGIIERSECVELRDELKARLKGIPKQFNEPQLEVDVWKPEELYQSVHGVAPDLIVGFSGTNWVCDDMVGHAEMQRSAPNANSSSLAHPVGAFVLAAPNSPLEGELEGVGLLDLAPTLLDLAGVDTPACFQGESLLSGNSEEGKPTESREEPSAEDLIRQRLSGLGYI